MVADSGTKFFAEDKATLGVVYANNKDSMAQLETERQITGGYLTKNAEADLPHKTKEEFDERNKRILENTKVLAEAMEKLVGKAGIEAVVHPNLPDHPNFQYANEKMPDGASGLFYVYCENAWETAKKMEEKGLSGLVEYGGSFGFEKTRFAIFGGEGEKILRIAGGNESPEELLKILEVIEKLK